jgi:hypothetical protein
MYTLSPEAIQALTTNPELRGRLARILGLHENSIYRIYSQNDINNDLTKFSALEVIREESGLATEKILVKVTKDNEKPVNAKRLQI